MSRYVDANNAAYLLRKYKISGKTNGYESGINHGIKLACWVLSDDSVLPRANVVEKQDKQHMTEVEQIIGQIFHKYNPIEIYERDAVNYHAMTSEHTEILGQFLDYTGMDVKQLKKCLAKGYLQMVQETIDKAIKEVMDT